MSISLAKASSAVRCRSDGARMTGLPLRVFPCKYGFWPSTPNLKTAVRAKCLTPREGGKSVLRRSAFPLIRLLYPSYGRTPDLN